MSSLLKQIGDDIWIVDGDTVSFFGIPFSTRMTVIKLSDGNLWVHSPICLKDELQTHIDRLGHVAYLIAPNKLHHLYLTQWLHRYPDARAYAAPGLAEKRSDIHFANVLAAQPENAWQNDIQQTLFTGSPLMQEAVFFHTASKTLILTDLIENFKPEAFNSWQRTLARLTGIIAPHGKTPIDWRLSFYFAKNEARNALNKLIAWHPDNIVIAHGECIFGQGTEFLTRSFAWLK